MTPERQLDILTTCRTWLTNRHHWCQMSMEGQRSLLGRLLGRDRPACLVGSFYRHASDHEAFELTALVNQLAHDLAPSPYSIAAMRFNDSRSHAEVLALLDLAIAETRLALQSDLVAV